MRTRSRCTLSTSNARSSSMFFGALVVAFRGKKVRPEPKPFKEGPRALDNRRDKRHPSYQFPKVRAQDLFLLRFLSCLFWTLRVSRSSLWGFRGLGRFLAAFLSCHSRRPFELRWMSDRTTWRLCHAKHSVNNLFHPLGIVAPQQTFL